MPSSAVDSKRQPAPADPLEDAARDLADRGVVSVIWLDPALKVVGMAGAIPAAVVPGTLATDVLVELTGLEPDLLALPHAAHPAPLHLPNAAVMSSHGVPQRRTNLSVFWIASRARYLVLIGAVLSQASASDELDQEIRRRNLLEQDLAAKSIEYARINQQLEEFAYVISHDLNAPLRALRYLTGDIQRALDTEGPADASAARTAAAAIATQTRRMSKMLTDLLDYARIGRVHEAIASVDTRALIMEIITSLKPTTNLDLVVSGDWPMLETPPAPLDLVLRNLIENAVKHHDRPQGRIEITTEAAARHLIFKIADDGRGIALEWQSAIFEPFRKIDDAHHPDSSGIGLALVKKTVTTLGGSIEVISDAPAQRGTAFVVHWPLKMAIAAGK